MPKAKNIILTDVEKHQVRSALDNLYPVLRRMKSQTLNDRDLHHMKLLEEAVQRAEQINLAYSFNA